MMSFSTDFDGIGSGSYISINNFNLSSGTNFIPVTGDVTGDTSSFQQYLKERHEQQRREAQERIQAEAKRRAEEAKRELEKKELEKKKKQAIENVIKDFNTLKQLQGDNSRFLKEAMYIQEVFKLQKKFEEIQQEYVTILPTYRDRLSRSLDKIVVPSPSLEYHSILVWGLWQTPEEAEQAKKAMIKNPFTGERYEDVFAFGTKKGFGVFDLLRVSLDHVLSTFQTLSPQTQSRLGGLKGAKVDEVVCHSNGFRVVEVLIATGQLKVDKLRILGGDGVLGELDYLEKLATEKNLKEVSVYVIKGDPVPHSDLFWKIKQLAEVIRHPLETFKNKKNDPTYQILGLTDTPRFDPKAKVQVHILSTPTPISPIERHRYATYDDVIQTWRLSGCMTAEGKMDPRCIIH